MVLLIILFPLIDESRMNKNSLKKLESTQNKQKELGCEAEKFVLNYEKTQRLEHPKYDKIKNNI